MKRIAFLLVSCLLMMASLAAYADVIIEPEDAFYAQHQSRIL